jgi:hypothetical protein
VKDHTLNYVLTPYFDIYVLFKFEVECLLTKVTQVNNKNKWKIQVAGVLSTSQASVNLREYRRGIENRQSRETDSMRYKEKKNK